MTRKRTLAVAAVLALSGCAGNPAGSPAPTDSPASAGSPVPTDSPASADSPAPLPTLARPAGPPKGPTDQIKDSSWLVGTVTTGGTGPCYALSTDDGVDYALYSAAGKRLTRGTRIRIKTRAALVRIYCGPGKLVEMTAVELVR